MITLFVFIILLAIMVGIYIALSFDDEELIVPTIFLSFLLGLNITVFICCAIPDCKNKAINNYVSGKYRKEVTYKMVQKDSLMVPVDSTITYKLIKDENI